MLTTFAISAGASTRGALGGFVVRFAKNGSTSLAEASWVKTISSAVQDVKKRMLMRAKKTNLTKKFELPTLP